MKTLTRAAAAALAAAALTGCGGGPAPVTDVAPYCDDSTVDRCYDLERGAYVSTAGRNIYYPGERVTRGLVGTIYVVPAPDTLTR